MPTADCHYCDSSDMATSPFPLRSTELSAAWQKRPSDYQLPLVSINVPVDLAQATDHPITPAA